MRRKNWKNYSVDELEKLLPVSERWENQNLSNDFMFGKVMSDKKACAGVLNIILPEIETGEIIFTEIPSFPLLTAGIFSMITYSLAPKNISGLSLTCLNVRSTGRS